MDPDELPLDSLEDEALQRHIAELRAQVQLEEQRAMQQQKEQCRQAAIEEKRRLQERLRQLQQDHEAEEQAHCPALPSLPLSGDVPSHEQHPQTARDIKRFATAVPGHQCLSVSEAPVQVQEAQQEEQTEQRTEDVVLFSFMGPLLSESTGAQTVFVSRLSPTTSDECIGIFFENKRRNGGGPIKKLLRLNEVNALVHFRNHQDAESVVKKGHHMLDGSRLQVSLLNLEQFCERNVAVSSFSTGVSAQTVFVSCLSPTTSDECIGIFFENKRRNSGGPIKKLLRLNEVNALVHFRNHQDEESVVKKGPHMLDGSQLQVSLLNLEQFCERNVTVSSFSTSVCESKALALESKCILPKTNVLSKVQGSIKDADCSKPEFEEQGEAGREKHNIPNLKPWQVRFLKTPRVLDRFYKQYLGLVVSVDEERKTAELRAPRDIMKKAFSDVVSFVTCLREVKIPLSPALVKMYEKEDSVEWVQTTLIDRHEMVCHWEVCGDHLLLSGHSSNLSQMEKMFKSAFTEVKVNIKPEEMGVLKSLKWTSFKKQQTRPNCPSPVFFHSGDSIIIVDTPSNVSRVRLALQQLLHEVSQCVQEDSIPNLKPCQAKVLNISRALEFFYKKYPGLKISVDEDTRTAEVRAPGYIMTKALYDVLYFVALVREVKIPLSPALVSMYEKEDSVEWVQTTLIDKHCHVCHWEVCGDHLLLCGQSSDLPQPEKMFKSAFTEVKVKMHPAEADAMQSPKWTSFVETQNGLNCPVPVFFPSGDSVIVVDTPSNISKTQLALRQFLDEISHKIAQETISNLTSSQMKVLSIPSALDVLYKHYPGLEVSVDEERKTAKVRAPGDIMVRALYDLLSFVTCLREVKIPLSPALVKMYEKEDSVEWIQTTLINKHHRVTGNCVVTTSSSAVRVLIFRS